jgi:hypothetical protein
MDRFWTEEYTQDHLHSYENRKYCYGTAIDVGRAELSTYMEKVTYKHIPLVKSRSTQKPEQDEPGSRGI